MSIVLHILNSSSTLNQFIDDIEVSFSPTVQSIQKVLPIKKADVVVWDNPEWSIEQYGIGGHTMTPYTAVISLDPKNKNIGKLFKERFAQTIMHELHHAARLQIIGDKPATRLEASIREGLAEHFEIQLTGKKPEIWDIALTPEQLKKFLKIATEKRNDTNYYTYDWLFGSKKLNIPEWTGYSLGFYLVDRYLKTHPNKNASILYATKAEEFL